MNSVDLDAAKARVNDLKRRMGFGCGVVVMMAAGDAARAARTYQRRKLGLRCATIDLPEQDLIRAMLKSGWYIQPRTGEARFEGAEEAAGRMMRSLIASILTRET